ncbi:Transcriptional regulatory protein YpdB [Sporomusa ovata DSM 2662]|uniref:Autolysin response regulator n=1 Tax=Sporomusa ovata TaxID=2378 RepID=A0A0U1L4S2_9FIRM|nr:LytTR family DNA-binding domain-containing protein [Sporomusa ovata]EQB28382.1 response regulator of the LytR/AlgR family [Sporomusa ovata DSM 2662]CQR74707.1 Autolysin response regulator [Sporomusa ovata]
MVKVVLIDDERYFLEKLASELGSGVEVAGNFFNMFDAVEKIKKIKITGMFSEDRIPAKELLKESGVRLNRVSDTEILLVMAHDQSALKSFKIDEGNEEVIQKQIALKKSDRISLWEGERIVLVDIAKIACCFLQKGNRKVTVVAENKTYQSNYTLNAFLNKIGENRLIRCHRSFAINPDFLSEMVPGENNTMVAKVTGYNGEIPVSRQYSPILRTIAGLHTRADCKKNIMLPLVSE